MGIWKSAVKVQIHNQNQRRRDVVNIFDVPLVIKILLNFSYSECYQTCVEVMILCCGSLTTKLRACFKQSLHRHDVSLNITFGSFVWQKKKVRSIFSSMREAYRHTQHVGWKNEAKLSSEKNLCKNFQTKLVPTWFESNVVRSQKEFSTKRNITRVVDALIWTTLVHIQIGLISNCFISKVLWNIFGS